MRSPYSLGILFAGELGDIVTTYIAQQRGLREINPIILALHLNWASFIAIKLLPVLLLTMVAIRYRRVRSWIADTALFAGGALVCVTASNVAQMIR